MLKIQSLEVNYLHEKTPFKALGPIDFTIDRGEIVCVIGPSGCGKSTLLGVLGGILTADSGSVEINGEHLDTRVQTIGYIPQGYGLIPWKTVYKNCTLPYRLRGKSVGPDQEKALESIFKSLGIQTLKKRYPNKLSGGQRQRVSIARAFFLNPEVLLMDEPFSALDAIMREEAWALFLSVWRDVGCSTILVTHSIEEALYLGNRIIIMSDSPGKIVEVFENPLFGNAAFRDDDRFKGFYARIKNAIKGGTKS